MKLKRAQLCAQESSEDAFPEVSVTFTGTAEFGRARPAGRSPALLKPRRSFSEDFSALHEICSQSRVKLRADGSCERDRDEIEHEERVRVSAAEAEAARRTSGKFTKGKRRPDVSLRKRDESCR
ncbi:hypothetical protein AOLI_G00085200 [Acnodon oligacanthus]